MQWLLRIVCIGYLAFLTLLLLTADPSRLLSVHGRLPWLLQTAMPWAHAFSFSVLALFALMTRWPMPRWGVVLILVIYGGVTEVLQSRLPPRTAEWMDWLQDLGGIAVGAACCWGIAMLAGMSAKSQRTEESSPLPASNDWNVLRNAAKRSAGREQSWWC